MKRKFDKIIIHLRKCNLYFLVIIFVAFDHITGALYSLFFTANNPVDKMGFSIYDKIFLAAVFAPVIETLLFQTLIINIIFKFTKNKILSIIISAVVFALAHNYSTAYVAKAFVAGIQYGLLYIVCKKHCATFHVLAAHSLYNFSGIVMYEIIPHLA